MVAFVHDYLSVLAHQVADAFAGDKALDHCNVDAPRGFLFATADLSHLLGAEPQEKLQLGSPLVQKGFAMHEHQGAHTTQGGHVGPEYGLPGTRRSYEDSQVERPHGLHGLLLHFRQPTLEGPFDRKSGVALLFHHEPATQVGQERLQIFPAAPGQGDVLVVFLGGADDPACVPGG
jgi:hypothetical protein